LYSRGYGRQWGKGERDKVKSKKAKVKKGERKIGKAKVNGKKAKIVTGERREGKDES